MRAALFSVADEGALGDLEDEALEREVGLTRGGDDVSGQGEVRELGERDVDGESEMTGDAFGCGEDCAKKFPVRRPWRPDLSARGMNSSGESGRDGGAASGQELQSRGGSQCVARREAESRGRFRCVRGLCGDRLRRQRPWLRRYYGLLGGVIS